MGMFEDVGDFHRKFGLPAFPAVKPRFLSREELDFRCAFMVEELGEFFEAYGMLEAASTMRMVRARFIEGHYRDPLGRPSLEKAADALGDLAYVVLGTAHFKGLPWDDIWAEIQRANMQKERASSASQSSRGSSLDVVKPEGWKPPNHLPALHRWANDPS